MMAIKVDLKKAHDMLKQNFIRDFIGRNYSKFDGYYYEVH